jgi:hypothetical protein
MATVVCLELVKPSRAFHLPLVVGANSASAATASDVMAEANDSSTYPMKSGIDSIKKISLTIFKEPSGCVGAQIGQLNPNGQSTIYKERGFDYSRHRCPHCSAGMKMTHQLSKPIGGCVIVVVRQQPNCVGSSNVF